MLGVDDDDRGRLRRWRIFVVENLKGRQVGSFSSSCWRMGSSSAVVGRGLWGLSVMVLREFGKQQALSRFSEA